jgi:hypothetical protein
MSLYRMSCTVVLPLAYTAPSFRTGESDVAGARMSISHDSLGQANSFKVGLLLSRNPFHPFQDFAKDRVYLHR